MRLSCHLYFRSDGTLGHYPVITLDERGVIISLEESDRMAEVAHTRFYCGVLVPEVDIDALRWGSREIFCQSLREILEGHPERQIAVGNSPGLLLLSGFDLNEFSLNNRSLIVNKVG